MFNNFKNCVLVTVLFCAVSTTPSGATGGVHCSSKNNEVELSIALGRLPIYAPLGAMVKYGDKHWSSNPQDSEAELGNSQGMFLDNKLFADFTDSNIEKIIVSLRVDYSGDHGEDGYAGTLEFEDGIVHNVNCLME